MNSHDLRSGLHQRVRVLVVDDLPDVRFSFMFMLQGLGYDVAEAADGAAALAVLANQRIDVVLTDLLMPGMDGEALARAIQGLPKPRPFVIAMSGQAAATDGAAERGFDAILRKPITREKLLETIRSAGETRIGR